MSELHAKVDVLEGELAAALAGAAAGMSRRAFVVLTLTRRDGTAGVGEASPLPGYSADSWNDAASDLRRLTERPLPADPLSSPAALLEQVTSVFRPQCPSARFALETALLDWLGHVRDQPLHRLLGGDEASPPIPIADLVLERDPLAWPDAVARLVERGAEHLKLKVGTDFARELAALEQIRQTHPTLPLRLDGNRRIPPTVLRSGADALESLELELLEEPVSEEAWRHVLDLPLPFALDETLRDRALSRRLLDTGKFRAVVLKPTVLGGLKASAELAELAANAGAGYLLSHTFDGPIARAASAELALALRTPRAAGLGVHPALGLWPPHRIDAIRGRVIEAHDAPGLGLRFEEASDA